MKKGVNMQNITRTLTVFHIKAYDLVEDEEGRPTVQVIAECEAEDASMTKALARAELAAATGEPMPKGITVKWTPIGRITYAMPLERFIDSATVIRNERIES